MHRQLALTRPYLRGPDVAAVQEALGGLVVDGIYGPLTAARVRKWQWSNGLPATGVLSRREQGMLLGLGVVRPLETPAGKGSEFRLPDPEGARADDGRRYHAGKDWFAPAGAIVRAPAQGKVVEARRDGRSRGQIFGGCVKIEDARGRVWVFRHVEPRVAEGHSVRAGQVVASVARWQDGPPHAHIEVWKSLDGGYDFENMLDPMEFFP